MPQSDPNSGQAGRGRGTANNSSSCSSLASVRATHALVCRSQRPVVSLSSLSVDIDCCLLLRLDTLPFSQTPLCCPICLYPAFSRTRFISTRPTQARARALRASNSRSRVRWLFVKQSSRNGSARSIPMRKRLMDRSEWFALQHMRAWAWN